MLNPLPWNVKPHHRLVEFFCLKPSKRALCLSWILHSQPWNTTVSVSSPWSWNARQLMCGLNINFVLQLKYEAVQMSRLKVESLSVEIQTAHYLSWIISSWNQKQHCVGVCQCWILVLELKLCTSVKFCIHCVETWNSPCQFLIILSKESVCDHSFVLKPQTMHPKFQT